MEPWLEKFIMDPDFPKLKEWISSFFEGEVDIKDIDTDRPSEAVHAELIARQNIANDIASFEAACDTLRIQKERNKTTFK